MITTNTTHRITGTGARVSIDANANVNVQGVFIGSVRQWGVGPCVAFRYRGSQKDSGVANSLQEALDNLYGNHVRVNRQGA